MTATLHDTAGNVPASVVVVFPTADPAVSGSDVYAKTISLEDLTLDQYQGTFGRSGAHIIHDSTVAHFTIPPNPTPANEAELLALAEQIATDFYLWRLASVNAVYRTVVAWTEEGMSDVEYVHGASIATVVRRSDWDPECGELKRAGTYPPVDKCEPRCIDVVTCTSLIQDQDDNVVGIEIGRQQICFDAHGCMTVGPIICEINPPPCCVSGSGSGSGQPAWWCVEVQECSDEDCEDCEAPIGVECVQYAFAGIGASRCVLLGVGGIDSPLYRRETAIKGPFNNQTACQEGCGGVTTACCGVVPQNLCALLSDGGCVSCAAGLGIDLAYVGVALVPCDPAGVDCRRCIGLTGPTWTGRLTVCGHPVGLTLSCGSDGNWYAGVEWFDDCAAHQHFSTCNGTLAVLQCTPKFHLRLAVVVPDECAEGGCDSDWYCLESPDTLSQACYGPLTADELSDMLADGYTLISGPHADQSLCLDDCEPPPPPTIETSCCPSNLLPSILNVAITNKTGDCVCWPDFFQVTYNVGTEKWEATLSECGGIDVQVYCDDFGIWHFESVACGAALTQGTFDCDPLLITFPVGPLFGCCGTGGNAGIQPIVFE